MITGILVDSNFYINHLRAKRNPFIILAAAADQWEFFTCGIIMLEVLRGVRDPHQHAKFETAFTLMNYIPSTHSIWTRARHLAWTLNRCGRTLPAQDHLIAASALHTHLPILTADRHFQYYPDLLVLEHLD